MLAQTGSAPADQRWAVEVKWDGMRGQLRWDGRRLCVRSRPGRDCTDTFPELAAIGAALGRSRSVVLDGEIVCLDRDGHPDFHRLRSRLVGRGRDHAPETFVAFDVLHLDGRNLRPLPYHARRALLDRLDLEGDAWRTPRPFYDDDGAALVTATREHGLEGVVAKRIDAPYLDGRRSSAWLKQKHRRGEVFAITGWAPGDRQPDKFYLSRRSADGALEPAGAVSYGITAEDRDRLRNTIEASAQRRRGRKRWADQPPADVLVEFHGPARGSVRDPIVRHVHWAR
jgi:bifunctional non-homologous end joining protein LigD